MQIFMILIYLGATIWPGNLKIAYTFVDSWNLIVLQLGDTACKTVLQQVASNKAGHSTNRPLNITGDQLEE
jgi:hypothetical protein